MLDTTLIDGNDGTFDCLFLHLDLASIRTTLGSFEVSPHINEQTMRYCRRSTLPYNEQMLLVEHVRITNHTTFTFDDLRSMNITHDQLYEWYAPIDIIEDYISGKQNGSFVNCSDTLWFGSKCEYTLDSEMEFFLLLQNRFQAKDYLLPDLSLFTNGTCYEMINSDCESIICLDWREICDGKIDCKNGFDERHCQELESNECSSSTEFRCRDGQCIDSIEYVSRVDTACSEDYDDFSRAYCYMTVSDACEDQKCAPLLFSCGDGHCYDGPSIDKRSCHSQRDQRYLLQMPSSSSSLILFSYVYLTYNNTQPKSICYNQTLCPYLSSNNQITTTYTFNGLTCHEFEMFSNKIYSQSDEMMHDVKRLVSSCSLLPTSYNHPHDTCSMFRCEDGSKCLSFYRLSDGIEDCANGEDERRALACSFVRPDLFLCDNGTRCISHHLVLDDIEHCNDGTDEYLTQTQLLRCIDPFSKNCSLHSKMKLPDPIQFYQICNGFVEYVADVNNNTDESNCVTSEWSCNRYISKCDGIWNCPDGNDELGCNELSLASLYCNNIQHFCLEIDTGKPTCLSQINASDGIIDCVGSVDERQFCRNKYPYEYYRRYRCRNSTICINFWLICNCYQDCPENDDETSACVWFYNGTEPSCAVRYFGDCGMERGLEYDGRQDLFCDLLDARFYDLWILNQRKESSSILPKNQVERRSLNEINYSEIWTCNRGIYVRSIKDSLGFACLCPVYYYGDRCQYQRKRIRLKLYMQMLSSFHHQISIFKFVVLLVHTNKTFLTIISHDQFMYMPQYICLPRYSISLLYSINEPYRLSTNHSIHIHMFDSKTLQHRYSWNFSLSFEFLPLQKLDKRLLVPEMDTNFESRQISIPYTNCTSCSNNSVCVGHDVSLARDICVCSLNYVGRRCLVPFNPCTNTTCSGHGTCQTLHIYQDSDDKFICFCESNWTGKRCELYKPIINVSLSRDLTFRTSNIAFLHIVDYVYSSVAMSHRVYVDRFSDETSNLTFRLNDRLNIQHSAFIQFYEHQYKFDYYLLFLHKLNQKPIQEIHIEIQSSHRCRSINELFDTNILAQSSIRRVKNYQQPCRQHQYNKDQFFCFYDDYLMCVCHEDNYTNCFSFQTKLHTCDKEWCHGRGMCVQSHEICLVYSRCICEPCAYGSFCQFSTGGYTLSLDGIIGSHILLSATSFSQQPQVVRTTMTIISLVVVFGVILNLISICTFIQRETHEVGCGLYLLASAIVGVLTVIILSCKMIFLLMGERSHISCLMVEYLLKWCPTSCEWLNTCVAIERLIAVKRPTQYSRPKSKYVAKWIVPTIFILVGLICMPELYFRGIITDRLDGRAWCVLTLNSDQRGLFASYSALNILSFLIPLTINLVSAVIIIIGTLRSKQKTNKNENNIHQNMTWRIHLKLIKTQIVTHKHILIAPAFLGILSLPRLILTFIFVCTKLDQNSIPSLIAYLVAFLPSMAILFAFILPAHAYRSALIKSMKIIIPNCVQRLFTSCRNSS